MKTLACILVAFALGMLTSRGLHIYKAAMKSAPIEMPEARMFPRVNSGRT